MKVHITGVDGLFHRVYITEEHFGEVKIARFADGLLYWDSVGEGSEPPPTLRLDGRVSRILFQALAQSFDQMGVRTESESRLAGILEATRAHLADMRELAGVA